MEYETPVEITGSALAVCHDGEDPDVILFDKICKLVPVGGVTPGFVTFKE